jgi:metal-responsive CopG/Arc/MetJ family transcriptional regulator
MTVRTTTKVMITLPPALLENIDAQAAREQTSRSGLIRQVLERYLAQQRRAETHKLLKEGYLVYAERDREMSEEFAHADFESLRDAPWDEGE